MNAIMKVMSCLVLSVFLCPSPVLGEDRFILESDFGDPGAWTEAYLNDAWTELVRLMDNRKVKPPMGIHVRLTKDPNLQGIAGYASPEGIGFTSDQWPMDSARIWIAAHELTNLFAHHYGGGGGYPSDWWSNGRSPFPEYVSCLVMEKLGHKEAAKERRQGQLGKADHALYWVLHEKYGYKLFSRFFKLVQEDGIVMGDIGAAWPAPDEVRSAYTIAYLSMAAGTNLAPLMTEHGIGLEPSDWRRIHPEIPFMPYEVTEEEVEGILAVRELLFDKKVRGKGAEILKELYRKGRTFRSAKDTRREPPTTDSPVRFTVESQFGAESDWTKGFLEQAAAALVRMLHASDVALPDHVPVNLRKQADLGGIGGGASRDAMDFISDCWPKEPFRLWILSKELAKLVSFHLGGNLPENWWDHGDHPFASYASVLVLEELGYDDEAAWVRSMQQGKADQELLWHLHEKGGAQWAPRFFHLLRADGIDYEALGAEADLPLRVRTLYVITYLSLACDTNLAKRCASCGIGKKPADWDSRNPDKLFKEYRITAKEVDRLMALRKELFGGKDESATLGARRERFRRGEFGE